MNTISSSGCDTSKRPPATPSESVHLAIAPFPCSLGNSLMTQQQL